MSVGLGFHHGMQKIVLAAALLSATATVAADAPASKPADPQAVGANLALGCRYTLSPTPNYSYCTDPDDAVQLTDGKTTRDYFWTQKGTVGWSGCPFALVTIDLGRVQPIQGVKFNTAARAAGVEWPTFIEVLVSDDGRTYDDLGDLVAMDCDVHGPLPDRYALRQFSTSGLKTHGRYVQFLIAGGAGSNYLFVDEIEVHRGPDAFLKTAPVGKPAPAPQEIFRGKRASSGLARRFRQDVESLRKATEAATISESQRRDFLDRLGKIEVELKQVRPTDDPAFRAVLPIGDVHAKLFRLQAALWKASGSPACTLATPRLWDPAELFAAPSKRVEPVAVHMMRGEYRAAAVDLYNATDRPMKLQVRLEGLPGGATPSYVAAHEVPWTDTGSGTPVAAALPEIASTDGAWNVVVEPGLVRQVWFTFHPTDVAPDRYEGKVTVRGVEGVELAVPLTLDLRSLEFPKRTKLLVGGWCYTDGDGGRGVTKQNRPAFLKHVQERFVNAPWASPAAMATAEVVDGASPKVRLDTRRFDDWLAQWPNAERYMVFAAVHDAFAGKKAGTPEFDRCVGAWISAWVKHLRGKGVAPERLNILLYDEPHEASDVKPLLAWSRAIRAAEPKVVLWLDPTYTSPTKAPVEVFESADILCPNRPMWLEHAKEFDAFYAARRKMGQTLHFYSCSGPVHLLDPYSYFRMQAWHAWRVGAEASFFWALGDTCGASSWNQYFATAGPYCPLFLDAATVTGAKYMEAIRESAEDYQYLVMLRDAAAKAKAANSPLAAKAETFLKTAVDDVLADQTSIRLTWHENRDRTKADAVRLRLLDALQAMAKAGFVEK